MYNWIRQRLTLALRIPPEPQAPFGAPGSVRIFRAGKNFYNLRLATWAFAQIAALAAILFWAVMFIEVEATVREQKTTRGPLPALTPQSFAEGLTKMAAGPEKPADATAPANPETAPVSPPATSATTSAPSAAPATTTTASTVPAKPEPAPPKVRRRMMPNKFQFKPMYWFTGLKQALVELGLRLPDWAFPLLWAFKILGFLAYLAQIPVTYVMRRLDYELRWYIVTDRSLRIRAGLMRLQESTMSFANLQQVEVKQNPIQRLLKLADVHVQSAGGGGDHQPGHEHHDSLHTGIFHSVENATEIRDLILERLRQFRQTGLGDPDDHHDHALGGGTPSAHAASPTNADTLAAAREVLAEAKTLRAVL